MRRLKISFRDFESTLGGLITERRNQAPDGFTSAAVKIEKLEAGGIFIAFNDEENDGLDHLAEAVATGVSAIATTVDFDKLPESAQKLAFFKIEEPVLFAALAAELFAGYPADGLELYAVTGTNGKTTTAMLLHRVLVDYYGKAGLISTLGSQCGGEILETGYTTPPPFVTQEQFAAMQTNGVRAAVLENSSHGLDQYRTSSAKFKAAIFTNLTGDHLDYHLTMENYYCAKERLFTELIAKDGVAVINIDDQWGGRLLAASRAAGNRAVSLGRSGDAQWRIADVVLSGTMSRYSLISPEGVMYQVATPQCGEYNVYNTAGVAAAMIESGIPAENVLRSLASVTQIPGRLESISNGRVTCFVDYAHTHDALERVLLAVKPWCEGKLIAVFGCGGDRDRTKRPLMGAVASRLADTVVVTSDNPRTEDPNAIIRDILGGIAECKELLVEPDRAKAIQLALTQLANPGDVILLAGKGHEDYQIIGTRRIHFDDREEVRKWL